MMKRPIRSMVFLAMASMAATSMLGSEEVVVLGVAKAGDGSETANAWTALQKKTIDGHKQAMDQMQKMMATPGASSVASSMSSGPGDRLECPADGSTPADWVVRLKPLAIAGLDAANLPKPPISGGGQVARNNVSSVNAVEAHKEDAHFFLSFLQGQDDSDWIAVKAGAASEGPQGILAALQVLKAALNKGGEPLTAKQEGEFNKFLRTCANPELADAWKKVQAQPADLKIGAAFVRSMLAAIQATAKAMEGADKQLLAILTPKQLGLLGGGGPSRASSNATSSGPGNFSVSAVSQGSKTTLTVSIVGKRLEDAFESLVGSVNSTYGGNLVAPALPEDLAAKIVSVKLILDGALEKLANAAGARLEKQAGKLVVVAGK